MGWELASIRPVFVGKKGDILIIGIDALNYWTYSYLCSFKRRTSLGGDEPPKKHEGRTAADHG